MATQKPLMTDEQQKKFRQAVNQQVIKPMSYTDYCAITPEQAEEKIREWEKDKTVDFTKPVTRINSPDRAEQKMKTPDQVAALRYLVATKRLTPISKSKWEKLTAKEAGRLIHLGKQRESKGGIAKAPRKKSPSLDM